MSNREDFQYGSTANYPLLIEQRFRNLRIGECRGFALGPGTAEFLDGDSHASPMAPRVSTTF